MKHKTQTATLLTVAIWLVLLALGFFAEDWFLAQIYIYLCYGIFALGLSLIWGQAGILSFGQAVFFGAGAYSYALVTLGMFPGLGMSASMGFVLAIAVPAILAAIVAWLTFSGRGLSGAHFAIVTLCAAAVVEIAATRSDFLGGYNGLFGVPPLTDFKGNPLSLTSQYFVMLVLTFAIYVILSMVIRSPYGTLLLAIREDENRVIHLGYNTRWLKASAFIVAGILSGLAGALFASQFGFVSPTLLGFGLSTQVLIWVAVGGRSVLMAALLGALLVPGAENTLSSTLGNIWQLLIGILFVLVVVISKSGVFGSILKLPTPSRLTKHHSNQSN